MICNIKASLLSVLLAIILPLNCGAQTYLPLIGQTNIWNITNCYNGCLTDSYNLDRDTTINGLDYRILNGFHYISGSFLVRENLNDQKIYMGILDNGKMFEYLIYDFSLNEGDSVQVYNPVSPLPHDVGMLYVDSTSTVTLEDGVQHKVLYLSTLNKQHQPIWVEGVGSLSLINTPCATPDINDIGHLSCYSRNNVFTYSNLDSIESCNQLISLSIEASEETITYIQNNIIQDEVIIQHAAELKSITIFNINGSRVYQIANSNSDRVTFDLFNIQAGLYIIHLEKSDGQVVSRKIVKI